MIGTVHLLVTQRHWASGGWQVASGLVLTPAAVMALGILLASIASVGVLATVGLNWVFLWYFVFRSLLAFTSRDGTEHMAPWTGTMLFHYGMTFTDLLVVLLASSGASGEDTNDPEVSSRCAAHAAGYGALLTLAFGVYRYAQNVGEPYWVHGLVFDDAQLYIPSRCLNILGFVSRSEKKLIKRINTSLSSPAAGEDGSKACATRLDDPPHTPRLLFLGLFAASTLRAITAQASWALPDTSLPPFATFAACATACLCRGLGHPRTATSS
jgi:hypothetical protein